MSHTPAAPHGEPSHEEKRSDSHAAHASGHGAPGWAWWSLLFNVFSLGAVIVSLGAVFNHTDAPDAPTSTVPKGFTITPPEVVQQSAPPAQYFVTSRGCSFSDRWNRNMHGGAILAYRRTSRDVFAADSVAMVCMLTVPEDQAGKTSATVRVSYTSNGKSEQADTSYTIQYWDSELTHVMRDLRPGTYEAVVLDKGRRVDGTSLVFEISK